MSNVWTKRLLSLTAGLLSFLIGVALTNLATIGQLRPSAMRVTAAAHAARITSVAMTPAGKFVASGDASGTVKVWRTGGGDLAWERTFDAPVLSLAFSKSGTTLAVLTRSGDVQTFSTYSGDTRAESHPVPGDVIDGGIVGFSSACGGPGLLVYGGDQLNSWADRIGSRDSLHPFDANATCIGWAPSVQRYASGNRDGVVKVSDQSSYTEIVSWTTRFGHIHAVALSSEGNDVAAAGDEGIEIRDVDGNSVAWWSANTVGKVTAVGFASDASKLVTGDANGTISVWDRNSGDLLQRWSRADATNEFGNRHMCAGFTR